jgi:hypothetical protein
MLLSMIVRATKPIKNNLSRSFVQEIGVRYTDLINSCIEKMLVDEYEALLKKATDAVMILDNSYPVEQVIAILQRVPLSKWGKVTKRLAKEEWQDLVAEYRQEEEDLELSDDLDEYEKLPKHAGFGRSKQGRVF